jgi:CheY-like chemotaxis protein
MNTLKSIMVVDDQEDITRFLVKSLTGSYPEVNVTGFTVGLDAVEWLGQNTPDAIITDLRMPGCGGVEVITAAVDKNPQIPILVISSISTLEAFKTRGNHSPTVRFLSKPFLFQDLKGLLDRMVSIEPESVIHGFRPISLLQVIQLENKNCRLDLEENNQIGTLIFHHGELVRAETPLKKGQEALFEILDFHQPTIKLFSCSLHCEFNIKKPLQELLLNYCHYADEKIQAKDSAVDFLAVS